MKDRSKHTAFVSALKLQGKDDYTKFAPILYPGGIVDQTKLFRVETLPLVTFNFWVFCSETALRLTNEFRCCEASFLAQHR